MVFDALLSCLGLAGLAGAAWGFGWLARQMGLTPAQLLALVLFFGWLGT